jgi:hypothetical protein
VRSPILLPFHITEFCAERNPQITYIDLLRGVRCVSMFLAPHCIVFTPAVSHSEILRKKYSQRPQLSATHKVVSHRLVSLTTLTPHLSRIKTYILSCNRMVIDLYQDVIVIILYVELFSVYLAVSVPLAVS